MSGVFGDYPDDMEIVPKSVDNIGITKKDIKKLIKNIRKLRAEERKRRKLLQKEQKKKELSEQDILNDQEEHTGKNDEECSAKSSTKKKSFLNRMGEAFLKALPSIFRTVTNVAVTLAFGFVSKRFGLQRRAASATG